MSWFNRQAEGRNPEAVAREHGRYLRAAGVDGAMDALAGPFGVRRFLVFFQRKGAAVLVDSVEAIPLAWGGGPPPEDPTGSRTGALEKSLTALQRNMATGPSWDRGAVGYVRDAEGRAQVFPAFDEDADVVRLDSLPVPGPPGHPLESPDYERLLARFEPAMGRLQARTAAKSQDWDWWEVHGERLLLHMPDGSTTKLAGKALATFSPARGLYAWQVAKPLFDEEVFTWPEIAATMDAAMELGLLSAARLDAAWLLMAPVEDEDGTVLLVAVLE